MTSEQIFNCIFCEDVFTNKEDLQVHFRKHGDPAFNKKNKRRFSNDSEMSGEKPAESSEMVGCDVCSKMFTTISKAITHKHKFHPNHDTKYFCPWCGKLFTMKHLYNKHIQSNHSDTERPDDKSFHCDSCNVDFFVLAAVTYHNKFFHRQDVDMPDIGQSKKFKLHNQEIIFIFYCAFCGEEYDNKVNLCKHVNDDHADENQSPDEVLRCPLCEAIFYHLDAYEIHLTFHTPEDLYSVQNEMFSDLQEFSLESLPPVVEKVENLDSQDDAETLINSVGIDQFLDLAMDHSQDVPVKIKKHKKHKKSKKSAITLDEFLNMNTDVFGEGLDFQGIEEVPTRIITKRLKNTKKQANSNKKVVTPVELEKLKQQGIVIKKKVSENPADRVKNLKGVPVMHHTIKKNIVNKINSDMELSMSDKVLSKLMSQSNNEIKIVKKSIQENKNHNDKQVTTKIATPDENCSSDGIKVVQKMITDNNKEDCLNDTKGVNISNNTQIDNTIIHGATSESHDSVSLKPSIPIVKETSLKIDTSKVEENIHADTDLNNTLPSTTSAHPQDLNKFESVPKYLNSLQDKGTIVIKPKINDTDAIISHKEENEDSEHENNESDNDFNANDIAHDNNIQNDNIKSQNTSKSLSALKHLSHLITVKHINQNKINAKSTDTFTPEETTCEDISTGIQNLTKGILPPIPLPAPGDKEMQTPKQTTNDGDSTLDALKNLSKNITIKSFPKSTKTSVPTNENESEDESDIDNKIEDKYNHTKPDKGTETNRIIEKIQCNTKIENKLVNPLNNPNKNHPERAVSVLNVNKSNSECCVKNKNANILKHLPNITTKPATPKKAEQIICEPTIPPKQIGPQDLNEIEIFNIDDSDDENDDLSDKQTQPPNAPKSLEAFKNLSKNITVKSIGQQVIQKNLKDENNFKSEEEQDDNIDDNFTDDSEEDNNAGNATETVVTNTKTCSRTVSSTHKNISLKNALKNLSKHITVKSRTASPSTSIKSQDYNSQDSNVDVNDASDSDSNPSKVNITEINEHASDNETNPEINTELTNNAIVQSPDDSCSDDNQETEDDFEKVIKANTVQKTLKISNTNKSPTLLNTLKNLGKNITIKTMSDQNESEDKFKSNQESMDIPSKLRKQLTMRPSQILSAKNHSENVDANKNPRNVTQIEKSSNQSNEKVSSMSSSNQVNTVNKEVTVKTFQTQTKTVIQEITTTVTKTIKTINQTMKQELHNTTQSSPSIKPQKVQGMRTNLSNNNLQGVIVRHAAPTVRSTKIGNSGPQVRQNSTLIRPSKQIVPVRPGMNVARPSVPRMPAVRKPIPAPNSQKPVIGKPLKISPNAMNMTSNLLKRSISEEKKGPFSCFKKPKESLIPVAEVPNFSGEPVAQYASASHSSSSNFTSTTKVMKGNCVVTSTQVKSEMSANAQQISRLSNNSEIKVVKTSQAKQVQSQEKSETDEMKQTTLAAIEKLQKQGLLVKKPRLEVNDDSVHSDFDDENVGYSSNEENE